MKKSFQWLLGLFVAVSSACAMSSCSSDDDEPVPPQPEVSDLEREKLAEWEPCEKLTYISGIESEDADFQSVLRQRFPRQTNNPAEAEVAFVNLAAAKAHYKELNEAYNRGALIVMMRPNRIDMAELAEYLVDDDEDEEGYWDDDQTVDDFFSENEQLEEIFYAYTKADQFYTMYGEKPFDGNYPEEDHAELSEEVQQAIRAYHEQHPVETETDSRQWLYDNDADQNENYFQARFDPFVDFIEEIDRQKQKRAERRVFSRADDAADLSLSVEDGYFFVKDMPVSLNRTIEKYSWSKSSTVTIKYWVSSAYMLSGNGQNKAGDYYMVKSEITPHIKPLWEVSSRPGGMFNWGRCRIYAYWFDSMDVEYQLLNESNQPFESNIQYYKHPIPDNENTETSYSKGFSWGLNGAISGEVGSEGPKAEASVGFSLEWSSETSYSLKSIQYERNSSSVYPAFRYWTNNVKLTDANYESEQETNVNFPAITHTEFSASTAWIWRVPRNSSIGVDDNRQTQFKLRVSVKPVFASWYHWRGAVEYDSNKNTYNGYTGSEDGWYRHTEKLPAPDRTPWGVLALKNAASSYTIGNIKIYKQAEFDAKGINAPVFTTIPSSYNVNEVAKKTIPEGTYAITYQAIDPNLGNSVVSSWKYENIVIEQGDSPASATTEISSINAQQIL